jgi:hypothetical protein
MDIGMNYKDAGIAVSQTESSVPPTDAMINRYDGATESGRNHGIEMDK